MNVKQKYTAFPSDPALWHESFAWFRLSLQGRMQEEAEKQEQEIAAEKAALLELKGKTAIEALEFAKTTTYEPYFNDAYGVGVTEDVRSAGKDDEIAKEKQILISKYSLCALANAGLINKKTINNYFELEEDGSKKLKRY